MPGTVLGPGMLMAMTSMVLSQWDSCSNTVQYVSKFVHAHLGTRDRGKHCCELRQKNLKFVNGVN